MNPLSIVLALPFVLALAVPVAHGTLRHGPVLAVVNKPASTLSIIDLSSGRVVSTIQTGMDPHEVATSPDGRWAVVTDYGAQVAGTTLTVVDLHKRAVARTIALPANPRPHGIVFLPGNDVVVVSSEASQSVVLVDVAKGVVLRAVQTGQAQSHMAVVSPDGRRAYTANIGPGTISEIDLEGSAPPRSLKVGTMTEAINISPDGKQLWVGSNNTGKVFVIDRERWAVIDSVQTNGFPYRIAFTSDGSTALVTNPEADAVQVLDAQSRAQVASIRLGGGPLGIATSPDGNTAWITLSGAGEVAEIDLRINTVRRRFPAGMGPDGIAFAQVP
jgi:YVTN family beta-propeller protein